MQGPNISPQIVPSQNERLMALASHLSILLPHFGLVVSLVLWLANKDTAPFAAYQSKQAFFFHLASIVLFWVFLIVGAMLGLITFGIGLLAAVPLLLVWHTLADIYGIVGAVHTFQGRDFRYLVIGSMVQPD